MDFEEDEVQDWKIFSSVVASGQDIVPKRGDKDFEPEGTDLQAQKLQESRNAMYGALEVVRGYSDKQELVGVWFPDRSQVYVPYLKGPFFKDCGSSESFGPIHGAWLHSWEALYLCERGSMRIYLSNDEFDRWLKSCREMKVVNKKFEYSKKLISMSLGHFYSYLTSETLDQYLVYAYLKRLGYIIMPFRPSDWTEEYHKMIRRSCFNKKGFGWSQVFNFSQPGVLQRKHYFSYKSIYNDIQLIPAYSTYDSLKEPRPNSLLPGLFRFDVWQPQPNFSKNNPGIPDFQLAIFNTRTNSFPDLGEIFSLFDVSKLKPSGGKLLKHNPKKSLAKSEIKTKREIRQEKHNQRLAKLDLETQNRVAYLKKRSAQLKFGARSFTLAVIDNGVINFVTLAEGDFSLKGLNLEDLDALRNSSFHGLVSID